MDQPCPPQPPEILAEVIRRASREVRLLGREEAEVEYAAANSIAGLDLAALWAETLAGASDLQAVADPLGRELLYSQVHLSRTFAHLLARRGFPVAQVAETVRENSALYPRPIPLDIFTEPPFDLTAEEVQAGLRFMHGRPDYADIAAAATSVGTIYLYSTRYLDHDYAAFLAERQDVGLIDNP